MLVVVVGFYLIGWLFTENPALLVLKLWIAGWLLAAVVVLISRPLRDNYSGRDATRLSIISRIGAFILTALLSLIITILWPPFIKSVCENLWPKLAVRTGLYPAWILPQPDDIMDKIWTLSDGREFSASVTGVSHKLPQNIFAQWPHGAVNYRLSQLAPNQSPATEWERMKRISMSRWSEMIEEEHELHEPRPYEAEPTLKRGKYMVEFRVEVQPKKFEELSGLSLIVT